MKIRSCAIAAVVSLLPAFAYATPEYKPDITLDYTCAAKQNITDATTTPALGAVDSDDVSITLSSVAMGYGTSTSSGAVISSERTGYVDTFYSPWCGLMNNTGGWTWELTFESGADMYLQHLQMALFSFVVGNPATAATDSFSTNFKYTLAEVGKASNSVTATKTVTYAAAGSATVATASYDFDKNQITSGSGAMVDFDLSGNRYLLENGKSYTLTLHVDMDGKPGLDTNYGVGIGGVKLFVPEPATATLSLLALAALSSRRRRK